MKFGLLLLAVPLLMGCLLPTGCSIARTGTLYADTYQAGLSCEKSGKFADARSQYETAYDRASTPAEKFNARIAIGRIYDAEGKYPEARAEYGNALDIEGITTEQVGRATFNIGASWVNGEHTRQPGFEALRKVIVMEGASTADKIEAHMMIARSMAEYRGAWAWPTVVSSYESALVLPGMSPEQKSVAQEGLARAHIGLKQYGEALEVLADMTSDANLPAGKRSSMLILAAKMSLLQKDFARARVELAKALEVENASDADKADIQLQIARSYYDAKDYGHAKTELLKLLTMPGATAYRHKATWDCGYTPAEEARLLLRLQDMVPSDEPEIAVLFIGSSMISRGEVPRLFPEISDSAPSGRPRVVFGMYARNATVMKAFWEEGNEMRGTPQRVITEDPWDMVVLETFNSMTREDLLKYGGFFANLAHSRKVRPIFYEAHPPQAMPYPDATRRFHEDNVAACKALNVTLAPVALAEVYYVEAVPSAKREEFYDDWVHPSEKGRYMAAYCIYSAITGYSPVGLFHPKSISDEEAKALQEAAWKAIRETNPNLKPLN